MSAAPAHGYVSDYVRAERVRDFQPPWRWVYVYACGACGAELRMRVPRGGMPRGGVRCDCGATIRL